MSAIISEQPTPITYRTLITDGEYASRSSDIIDRVFDFIDEHGTDVSVHFLFEKYTDGSYSVRAELDDNSERSVFLGEINRSVEDKRWTIYQPMNDEGHKTREAAAAYIWRKLNIEWRESARNGKRTTPAALAQRERWDEQHFEWIVDSIERNIRNARERLTTFTNRLLDLEIDPCHTFQWGSDATDAAAVISTHKAILDRLAITMDSGCAVTFTIQQRVQRAHAYAAEKALDGARSPSRSTSPMANIMDQNVTSQWARLADELKGW